MSNVFKYRVFYIKKISNIDHCMMFQTTQATYDRTFICSIVTSFEGKDFRCKTMAVQKISAYIIVIYLRKVITVLSNFWIDDWALFSCMIFHHKTTMCSEKTQCEDEMVKITMIRMSVAEHKSYQSINTSCNVLLLLQKCTGKLLRFFVTWEENRESL